MHVRSVHSALCLSEETLLHVRIARSDVFHRSLVLYIFRYVRLLVHLMLHLFVYLLFACLFVYSFASLIPLLLLLLLQLELQPLLEICRSAPGSMFSAFHSLPAKPQCVCGVYKQSSTSVCGYHYSYPHDVLSGVLLQGAPHPKYVLPAPNGRSNISTSQVNWRCVLC